MKKNLIFLSFFALLLSACTSAPQAQPSESQKALTGLMTQSPTHNAEGIPYCKPYQLKPLQTGDIIKIDDVMENCTFKKGHITYFPFGGGGALPDVLNIRKNGLSHSFGYNGEIPFCDNNGHIENLPRPEYTGAIDFANKYFFPKEQPFNTMYAQGIETEYSVGFTYRCQEKELCKKLIDVPFGENENHYFYRLGHLIGELVKVDEQIYLLGEWNEEDEHYVKKSRRNVEKLEGNKLIIHRYIDGELIQPYKSRPDLIATEQNDEKAKKQSVIIGTFNLQTCEVSLEKTL